MYNDWISWSENRDVAPNGTCDYFEKGEKE